MNSKLAKQRFNNIQKKLIQNYPVLKRTKILYHDKNNKTLNPHTNIEKNHRTTIIIPQLQKLNKKSNTINEFDFVEIIINLHHEAYHVLQIHGLNDIDTKSYISRLYNDQTYKYEYPKFAYEISAEIFAIKSTYNTLKNQIPQLETEKIILDYINAKIYNKTTNNEYQYPIQTKKHINTIEDALEELNVAYNNSLNQKKNFEKYQNDCVKEILQNDKKMKDIYLQTKSGIEQTHIVDCIVLKQHPEIYKLLPNINKNDYDINTLKNIYQKLPLKEKETKELPEYKTNETPDKELEP